MRKDTIQQLKEFQASMKKMTEGNMTLVDDFGAYQLVSLWVAFMYNFVRLFKLLFLPHFLHLKFLKCLPKRIVAPFEVIWLIYRYCPTFLNTNQGFLENGENLTR
jgi:hypothetical protein